MANNTVFDNKVIEAKAKDLLTTAINTRNLMTIDTSLTESAGMTKTINVYTYNGKVEELANGVGNTSRGSISFQGHDYVVKMNQQVFDYTDEEYMKDDTIVDTMLKGANQGMANKMTADFFTECKKASTKLEIGVGKALTYDAIVDAISKLNIEDESKLFVVIPNAWKAELRKDADYKSAHMGDVIYNGQVGVICGLPVVASKAIQDEAYVMSKEAVKLFMKKDVEVEQDRDANTRKNSVYIRSTYVVSLVDNSQICKITKTGSVGG